MGADTTGACSREVPSATARWTRSRTPAVSRRPSTASRCIYTTLSPCAMCSGAILLYGIPRVIVGENQTFLGEEALLRDRGVAVDVVQDPRCIELMTAFHRGESRTLERGHRQLTEMGSSWTAVAITEMPPPATGSDTEPYAPAGAAMTHKCCR